MLVALEALRRYGRGSKAAGGRFGWVDWADEEGARFGRSILAHRLQTADCIDEIRELRDAEGTRLEDAVRDHGVTLDAMLNARQELARIDAKAYLEMHIEQGPVLESMNRSAGVVLGTFGLERNMVRFVGQAAHAGSTPIAMRRDAFLAAAQRHSSAVKSPEVIPARRLRGVPRLLGQVDRNRDRVPGIAETIDRSARARSEFARGGCGEAQ